MNKLEQKLSAIKDSVRGRPALMTHVVLGYPSLAESVEIVELMAEAGASIIELQIPFSDPMADGPTIMQANEKALAEGVDTKQCLQAISKLSSKLDVPLLVMSYFNLLYSYPKGGLKGFCLDAKKAGVAGLIIPDVPIEQEEYWKTAKESGLIAIPLVSPVTDNKRLSKIAKIHSDGFVYCVSTTGTTGVRSSLPKDLPDYLKRVRKYFKRSLAVGFGISKQTQVRQLKGHAEIAIVGSATIDLIEKTKKRDRKKVLTQFLKSLIG